MMRTLLKNDGIDMIRLLRVLISLLASALKSKSRLLLENALLRQQLIIYQRAIKKPKLKQSDRVVLVWLSKLFCKWKDALISVKPETLIGWHRQGFKLYWQ